MRMNANDVMDILKLLGRSATYKNIVLSSDAFTRFVLFRVVLQHCDDNYIEMVQNTFNNLQEFEY